MKVRWLMVKHVVNPVSLHELTNSYTEFKFIVRLGDNNKALFASEDDAIKYKRQLEHYENIKCCRSSISSNGWHHETTCVNWVMCD
ncbi:hypothetical protein NVP2096O_51 [Vibrio phage 2.096.O._10N.286.48.B5]|nr:hypothetical protein NVP2096O_51 [Vibrio phage 2.096.O._10N.286.48.B5]